MDSSWSNFLFQTPLSQTQSETALQSELLPDMTGSAQSPPTEHIAPPPSTVDTAALNEEPLPGLVSQKAQSLYSTLLKWCTVFGIGWGGVGWWGGGGDQVQFTQLINSTQSIIILE
ncbi:unnamed protein product [Oncorhynchus mykiss]|uniref:Uncharacterized protein n=1 Tax=Oncorhynchus mykiss TaxID=8022 RepID=A0A060WUR2_ONCMY|nr:unnamed protein product [Oncorhynchus mykiss]